MQNIITKLRDVILDPLDTTGRQIFTYLSIVSSKIFTLKEANVEEGSVKVYKNGVEWSSDNYTYNPETIQVIVEETTGEELEVGDSLLVTFSFYKKYSDNALITYIKSAIYRLSVEQYVTFTIESADVLDPTPTDVQENLIAIIAGILIGGNLRSYRTPELTIIYSNDTDSIDKKIKNILKQFNKAYGVTGYINPDFAVYDGN